MNSNQYNGPPPNYPGYTTTTVIQQPGYSTGGGYTYLPTQQAIYSQQGPYPLGACPAAQQTTTYYERNQRDDCCNWCCASLAALMCGCLIGECTDSNVWCCLLPCPPLNCRW